MDGHGSMNGDKNLVESKRTGRMGWSVTILLLLAVCFWLGSGVLSTADSEDKAIPSEIRARRFVVVDANGNERGELGMLPSGQPALRIWDERKTIVGTLEIDQAGMPRFAFEKSSGEPLLELGVLDGEHPVLVLSDADGNRRLGIVVGKPGSVDIALYDTQQRNRCAISLSQDGNPEIVLRDDKGNVRARLMLDDKGTCALDFLNRKGQERIVFQVDAQGQADAIVFGTEGKPTWSASKP